MQVKKDDNALMLIFAIQSFPVHALIEDSFHFLTLKYILARLIIVLKKIVRRKNVEVL